MRWAPSPKGLVRLGGSDRGLLLAVAWIVVVVASMLPRVVLQELFHLGVGDEWRALVSGATVCVALFVAAAMPRLRWRPSSRCSAS